MKTAINGLNAIHAERFPTAMIGVASLEMKQSEKHHPPVACADCQGLQQRFANFEQLD